MCQNLWPDELKILVIDTDQEALNMIRYSLEPAGFRVIRTHKPQEGLELAHREQPDLLLLDVTMPEYDGFELLRYIRRVPPLELIPTIVVSTRAKTVDQQRILQLCLPDQEEIDAFVGKPVDPAQLLKTVKTVLTNHKQHLLHKKQQWEKMAA